MTELMVETLNCSNHVMMLKLGVVSSYIHGYLNTALENFRPACIYSWENDDHAISKGRLIYIMGTINVGLIHKLDHIGNANPVDSNVTCK